MKYFVTFFALLAVAVAAPQLFSTDTKEKSPLVPNPGFLDKIVNTQPLDQLLKQIDSLLNNVEALLPKIKGTQAEGPVGGLVINALLQVRTVLVNTLKQLEKAPNAVNKVVVDQLQDILGRIEVITKSAVKTVDDTIQGAVSGIIGGVSGILGGPVIEFVPALLTRVINQLQIIADKVV